MYQNADKTEFTSFNQEQETVLKSVDNKDIKKVDNFKYLGALIGNNENDVSQESPRMEILQ